MTARALTVKEVAERMSVVPRTILRMSRDGRFPAPIDPSLSTRLWRWSSVVVEAYESGGWKGAA